MRAVSTSHELRVYRRDGTVRWKRTVTGQDVLAGPAAWREDGRLAVMHRGACQNGTKRVNGRWRSLMARPASALAYTGPITVVAVIVVLVWWRRRRRIERRAIPPAP